MYLNYSHRDNAILVTSLISTFKPFTSGLIFQYLFKAFKSVCLDNIRKMNYNYFVSYILYLEMMKKVITRVRKSYFKTYC